MNILFLILISSYSLACGNDVTLEKIFSRNNGLPAYSHFQTYLKTLLTKASLREKHCGEKFDSPACFQKLRQLALPALIKLQDGLHYEDLLIHESSGQADIDKFLIKEFSNAEARAGYESKDPHRMPLIVLQSDRAEHFLNMLAVQCQQHLKVRKNELYLGELLVNPPNGLIEFLRQKPLPVVDFFKAFEASAISLETPARGADFFGLCLENIEKSCELTPDSELCEFKRTVKATAWKYSEVTHQINYFESMYSSSGEKLLNRLVLQTPRFVMDYGACNK